MEQAVQLKSRRLGRHGSVSTMVMEGRLCAQASIIFNIHPQDSQLNDTTERYATLGTPEYELVEKNKCWCVLGEERTLGSMRPRIIRIYSLGQNG